MLFRKFTGDAGQVFIVARRPFEPYRLPRRRSTSLRCIPFPSVEWMSNERADIPFNEGQTSLSVTANRMRDEVAQAMAGAAIEELHTQVGQ